MMNFLPRAFVSSRCRRNCFMAGSLKKNIHDIDGLTKLVQCIFMHKI